MHKDNTYAAMYIVTEHIESISRSSFSPIIIIARQAIGMCVIGKIHHKTSIFLREVRAAWKAKENFKRKKREREEVSKLVPLKKRDVGGGLEDYLMAHTSNIELERNENIGLVAGPVIRIG